MTSQESIKIKSVPLIRLRWFVNLNLEIHKTDPIFKKANETFWSRLKFRISFSSKIARQYRYALYEGKKIAGVISLEKRKKSIFVYAVGVSGNYRRKGYGTTLMTFAEDFTKKKGKEFICFSVLLENNAAISLYQKLGYKQIGIGLTLLRFFTWKIEANYLKATTHYKIDLNQKLNLKEIEKITFDWWYKEIDKFAGEEAQQLSRIDSLIDFDFKSTWHYYEILTDEELSGVVLIIPSVFFHTLVLFSNPQTTRNKDWLLQFFNALVEKKIIALKSQKNLAEKFQLNKTSMIQLFVTQQHKNDILTYIDKDFVVHDSTEDRQLYFKKIN
ncbi:MAG: GNAT family N-acetyltransferase [Candidatus Heimdallarchaeota archaeon]